MESSLLFKILKTFSKSQLNSLLKFVQSPFFNEKEEIILLITHLKKVYPFKKLKLIAKEHVYSKIFPNTSYNDGKMRQLMSNTKKLVEEFIAIEQLKQDEFTQNSYCIKYHRLNNIDQALAVKVKALNVQLNKPKYIYESYHYHNFQKAIIEAGILSTQNFHNRNKHFNKDYSLALDNIILNLNKFYFLELLRYTSLKYMHSRLFTSSPETLLANTVLDYTLDNEQYAQTIPINLYAHGLKLLMEQDEKNSNVDVHFDQLKHLLDLHAPKLEKHVAANLYRTACSYSIRCFQKGDSSHTQTLFDLYLKMLEYDLIMLEANFPVGTFLNIVKLALLLDKIDWAENFIHQYKKYLAGEFPEDIANLNLAMVEFKRANYDAVLDILNKVELSNDLYYGIQIKRLYIMVFYALDNIDLLDSQLNSFKVYIHRNKLISNIHKEMNKNFVNVLTRIVDLGPGQEKKYQKILKYIDETIELHEKVWLKEKLEEKRALVL